MVIEVPDEQLNAVLVELLCPLIDGLDFIHQLPVLFLKGAVVRVALKVGLGEKRV